MTVLKDGRALDFRVLTEGAPVIALDDEKSVVRTVEDAKARQQARPQWKPPADHPWKRMVRQAVAVASEPGAGS